MAIKTFAAIDVGSYEIGMKIFELSKKIGVREIDYVRHRIDLGTDTYNTGRISYERMDELCETLKGFTEIMKSYKVDDYRACGTSAIRETVNTKVVIDQIKLRTGLNVQVLGNSEQRFLDYKSLALKSQEFGQIIARGTAIIDIGGGSTQISLFSDSRLVSTVNLPLGILRLRSKMNALDVGLGSYEELLTETICNELHHFKKFYLEDIEVQNLIVVDDYLPNIARKIDEGAATGSFSAEKFLRKIEEMKHVPQGQVARLVGVHRENASLLLPSALLIKHFISITGAERLWLPGVTLSDGIAYDYADKNKLIEANHDFSQDIISCADSISQRYKGSKSIEEELVKCALAIFDGTKKIHGMSKRERLLLELAARLNDVGCFVSMSSPAECSYQIIMGTEIIGISHMEREIIATIVRNSRFREFYYEDFNEEEFDNKVYLIVTKLTAILRVAVGMSRSPKKYYRSVKAVLHEKELVITVESKDSMVLEKGLFGFSTDLFEEVFGIRPVLKTKKGWSLK